MHLATHLQVELSKKLDAFTQEYYCMLLYYLATLTMRLTLHKTHNATKLKNDIRRQGLIKLLINSINRNKVNNLDPISRNQLLLSCKYFSIVEDNSECLLLLNAIIAPSNNTTVSKLQHDVTALLKEYLDIEEEYCVNKLYVDILIPKYNIIVQVDGPTHFLHAPNVNPNPTPKDRFHDALLTQDGIHVVTHIPYFEWHVLNTKRERFDYLMKKLKTAYCKFDPPSFEKAEAFKPLTPIRAGDDLCICPPPKFSPIQNSEISYRDALVTKHALLPNLE